MERKHARHHQEPREDNHENAETVVPQTSNDAKEPAVNDIRGNSTPDDLLAWIADHGYELTKIPEHKPSGPVKTYENPPEDLFEPFEYTGKPDGFERILVQVTEDDLKQGVNKVARLRQEGWVVEKSFIDGAFLRMKRPAASVEAERARRTAEYETWLKPKTIAPPSDAKDASGKKLGTPVSESVTLSNETYTTHEVLDWGRTNANPPALE